MGDDSKDRFLKIFALVGGIAGFIYGARIGYGIGRTGGTLLFGVGGGFVGLIVSVIAWGPIFVVIDEREAIIKAIVQFAILAAIVGITIATWGA